MSKLKEFAEFILEVEKCDGIYQGRKNAHSEWETCKIELHKNPLGYEEFLIGDLRLKPKEKEKKKIPLEMSDIVAGMILKYPSFEKGMFTTVLFSDNTTLAYYWPYTMDVVNGRYVNLVINNVEYSIDNGKTWKGCWKYEN